jgi:GAF domain-containing protein
MGKQEQVAQEVAAMQAAELARENARLALALSEALERQAATADVLKVISRASFDLPTVLKSLVATASRLCDADKGFIFLRDGDLYRMAANHGFSPEFEAYAREHPLAPGRGSVTGRAVLERRTAQITDVLADPEYTVGDYQRLGGYRTNLGVPLMRDGEVFGVFTLTRPVVKPFTPEQITLVTTFADQAMIAIENARLFEAVGARTSELSEALEQQTATAEVLKVVSRSTFDLQSVLGTLTDSAARLCNADMASITRQIGADFFHVTNYGFPPDWVDFARSRPLTPGRGTVVGRALLERRTVQIADVLADPEYTYLEAQQKVGFRTTLAVPLLRDGVPIGVLNLCRKTVAPFSDNHLSLVQTFADQAVIAIENVRLLEALRGRTEDLSESLQQQTATADVLKVISRSSFDLPTVLNVLVESAARLCDADRAYIFQRDGELYRLAANHGFSREYAEFTRQHPVAPGRGTIAGRVVLERKTIHIPDALADPEYIKEYQARGGYRAMLGVPLMREGDVMGVFVLTRSVAASFTDKQIQLVSTFADQAVIAIENVRLFEEVQKRSADLSEALQQQTATADVLKVISGSAFNLQPVFETVAESAVRLCDADKSFIFRFDGEILQLAAAFNASKELREFLESNPIRPGRHSGAARCALERRTIQIRDVMADPEYTYGAKAVEPIRTVLCVPMLKGEHLFGVILLYHLHEVRPFTEKQVALIETFADQAVIAIENVRLFEEVQARTRELGEALEQQTATAEVLGIISSSPSALEPVFQAMLANATRICGAEFGVMFEYANGAFRALSTLGVPAAFDAFVRELRVWGPHTGLGQVARTRQMVHVADVREDAAYVERDPGRMASADLGGVRTLLIVPMLKEGALNGAISIFRQEVQPFSDKQIALVRSFAEQAVIAIENVRLLGELRESLRQQTATADVLKVISRSTFDLQTVLRTLLETAVHLCEADQGTITRQIAGKFYRAEAYGMSREFVEYVKDLPVEPDRGTANGRALLEGHIVHIPDVQADPEYTFVEAQRLGDYRSVLGVPMLKEGVAIGVLTFTRREVRPFTDKQIELVTTFADQAAIAIENVRLFESVEARTRELALSLDNLRTAQDRLIQTEKLASLGQLTAGIAHEIKNPLNFVNNFAAVSIDLIDELRALLEAPQLDASRRAEIGELADTLRDNLGKVEQHGKRADSIVKNMLLHSREGSGEHRPVDINAVIEESLNLAYHGARAESRDFNITLERSLDPAAGQVDLFPQEITRVLLNLISNGFYAAMKRKKQEAGQAYEPRLSAATRDLGDQVEIRIRDNGTGIPPEVKAKIFNPFFTTKPPGEGTGLGLSLSHDIVVKQHAGSLSVDTEPGQYTEFRIVLPRAAATIAKAAAKAGAAAGGSA